MAGRKGMRQPGNNKKSATVHDLKGSAQDAASRRNANLDEPAPSSLELSDSTAPDYLTEAEAKWYTHFAKKIIDLGVMARTDVDGVAMLASLWVEHEELKEIVGTDFSETTETATGALVRKRNPDHVALREAWDKITRYLGEFGLTPASRMRVGVLDKGKGKSKLERYRS